MRRLYLVAFFLLSTLLQAQDPAPETGSGPALPVLQEKLQREIAAIDKRLVEPDLAESAIRELRSTRASLERLALIYERHAVAEQLAGDLAVTIETAKTRLDQLQNHGLNEPPPYEFMKLEQVRDSLKIERTKWDALASTSQVTTDSLAAAKAEADAAESTMFKAREKLAANPGAPAGKSLRGLAQDARLKNAIAAGLVAEARAEGLARENQRLQLVILEQTVHVMEPHCRFARKDLDLILVSVEHEDAQLRTELHQIRSELEHADRQWIRAREAADPQAADDDISTVYWRLARQTHQQASGCLTARLERLVVVRELWQRRYTTFRGLKNHEQAAEWTTAVRAQLERWERDRALRQARIAEAQAALNQLADKPALRNQSRLWRQWSELQQQDMQSLASQIRLAEKLKAELNARGDSKIMRVLAKSWSIVGKGWNLELTKIDNKPITVSKVVMGIVLLVLGVIAARITSRQASKRLLKRLAINASAAHAIQTVIFYVLLATFTLLALQMVNVPLTAFTILGGALAIGLGFGSQNIMNNFVSGLILLIERPIKIGDLVEVDDLNGIVAGIGARSTLVRSGNNIDVVVPNSHFLENSVVNWTRTNRKVRVCVNVGVAYGSPVEQVRELLLKSLDNQKRVLSREPATVLFTDFGDNALAFRLLFWVNVRTQLDQWQAESDIRFAIDRLFAEADVVIAFPQQDVHLDVSAAIPVHITNES